MKSWPLRADSVQSLEVPSVSGGVLWPDHANKLFYLFGGAYDDGKVKDFTDLWFFDTIYNTWNKTLPDGSQADIRWPAYGASAMTDEGVAYYYGGYLRNDTDPRWKADPLMLNSLVSFDTKTKKWDNHTYNDTPRAQGNLHYIPASHRGMLVYIGGIETIRGRSSYVSAGRILQILHSANIYRHK